MGAMLHELDWTNWLHSSRKWMVFVKIFKVSKIHHVCNVVPHSCIGWCIITFLMSAQESLFFSFFSSYIWKPLKSKTFILLRRAQGSSLLEINPRGFFWILCSRRKRWNDILHFGMMWLCTEMPWEKQWGQTRHAQQQHQQQWATKTKSWSHTGCTPITPRKARNLNIAIHIGNRSTQIGIISLHGIDALIRWFFRCIDIKSVFQKCSGITLLDLCNTECDVRPVEIFFI